MGNKDEDNGDGGYVIPKSTLITLVFMVLASIGGGGFFMGAQSADIGRLDHTLKAIEDQTAKMTSAIVEIQTFVAVIKSKTEYDVGRRSKGP